jgi:hypothetical protein
VFAFVIIDVTVPYVSNYSAAKHKRTIDTLSKTIQKGLKRGLYGFAAQVV